MQDLRPHPGSLNQQLGVGPAVFLTSLPGDTGTAKVRETQV